MATSMRGLTQVGRISCAQRSLWLNDSQFIADIRGARVKELEEKRINKEMANIRKKFKGLWLQSTLPHYIDATFMYRWKLRWIPEEEVGGFALLLSYLLTSDTISRYVAKIIFTYILGYKVDVGHMEAINLISSTKYSEKQIVSTPHLLADCRAQRVC